MAKQHWRIAFITAVPSEKDYFAYQYKLQHACRRCSIQLDLFKNGEFRYQVFQNSVSLIHQGLSINPKDYNLVMVRFAVKAAHGGNYYAVRFFEQKGIATINPTQSLLKAKDKLQTLEILANAGLPVTPTMVVRTREQIAQALESIDGPPYIIKNCFGSEGRKVLQASTPAQVFGIFDYLWHLDRNAILLIQPYMGQEKLCDVRALYFNYRPWKGVIREAEKGEFRTNMHTGATSKPLEITGEEKNICDQATKILGLPLAGVDILRTKDGPVILEVNGCPGLKGIVATYEKFGQNLVDDFAEKLLHYMQNQDFE